VISPTVPYFTNPGFWNPFSIVTENSPSHYPCSDWFSTSYHSNS